jgi:hypothetical protein
LAGLMRTALKRKKSTGRAAGLAAAAFLAAETAPDGPVFSGPAEFPQETRASATPITKNPVNRFIPDLQAKTLPKPIIIWRMIFFNCMDMGKIDKTKVKAPEGPVVVLPAP